jgi:hypothetical protein
MFIEERTYTIRAGFVRQWLTNYETHALQLQRSVLGRFVGFFYRETPEFDEVIHCWAYASLDERSRLRAELSQKTGWDDYLRLNTPLLLGQKTRILRPMSDRVMGPVPKLEKPGIAGRREGVTICEHLIYTLTPGYFAEFRNALEQQGLPAWEAVFGKPFGVYITEIGPLNEVTLITAFSDERDFERKQAVLGASAAWKNFEAEAQAGISARMAKLISPADFATAGDIAENGKS